MEAKLNQFFAQRLSRNAQPAGGSDLIAMGRGEGAAVERALDGFLQSRARIRQLAALGRRNQLIHIFLNGLFRQSHGQNHLGERRPDVFDADGVTLRQQQHFAHDVFQLAHVARPGLCL